MATSPVKQGYSAGASFRKCCSSLVQTLAQIAFFALLLWGASSCKTCNCPAYSQIPVRAPILLPETPTDVANQNHHSLATLSEQNGAFEYQRP